MRYLASTLLFLFVALSAFAQQGAITNAILYHKDGELDKALTEIEKAVQHEKTKNSPEAWYYRGVIFEAISYSENPQYQQLSENAPAAAYESFTKSMSLDEKKAKYYKLSSEKIPNLYPAFINKGYSDYEGHKFDNAVKNFEMAQQVNPSDTTGYLYAMYAAEELERYDLIKKYISSLSGIGYKSAYLHYNLIHIVQNIDKDNAKALELSEKALKDFPGNAMLLEQQTNIYIVSNKREEAIANLDKLYKLNPKDVTVLAQLGVLHDRSGDKDKALNYYKEAIAVEPDNYVANFNSAVIYYDKGNKSNEKLRKFTMNSDLKEKAKVEQETEDHFNKALKYAEIALKKSKDPEDTKNIQLLISEINKVLGPREKQKSLH
ncbi:MAG: tetratricopeptide repeat protein [Cytophagaceae bacterium]